MSYPYSGQGVPHGMPAYDGSDWGSDEIHAERVPSQRTQRMRATPSQGRPPQPQTQTQPRQQRTPPNTTHSRSSSQDSQYSQRQRQPTSRQVQPAHSSYGYSAREQPSPQTPQWPLLPSSSSDQSRVRSPPRRPPPQRPPRPAHAPILEPVRTASNRDARPKQQIPQYASSPSQRAQYATATATAPAREPGVWGGDGYASPTSPSPNLSRPVTGSSRASTASQASSVYSVPDFPVPQMPLPTSAYIQQSRRPPSGPPPSARKGPASYYAPQNAHVAPIAEETDSQRGSGGGNPRFQGMGSGMGMEESRGSYASSNAIPIAMAEYYVDRESESDPESPVDVRRGGHGQGYGNGREARGEERGRQAQMQMQQTQPPQIVRKASSGKSAKPTLTTIKTGDGSKTGRSADTLRSESSSVPASMTSSRRPSDALQPSKSKGSREGQGQGQGPFASAGGARDLEISMPSKEFDVESRPASSSRTISSDILEPGNNGSPHALSSSTSSRSSTRQRSDKEMLPATPPSTQSGFARSPLASSSPDPRADAILKSLEAGRASPSTTSTSPNSLKPPAREGKLSDRIGQRRPPRLNVDAVRDAEARGSSTSSPDSIRRATRSASNLDRGRTASRSGSNWFEGATAAELEKAGSHHDASEKSSEKRRSGSLSDISASFPPPGSATPGSRGSSRTRPVSVWPSSGLARHHSASGSDSEADGADTQRGRGREGRRCCGMPSWSFWMSLLVSVSSIAAAIIVPVVSIVVPRQAGSSAAGATTGSDTSERSAQCRKASSCANGGTNISGAGDTCRCLCVNGFTGTRCATASGAGCATTDIAGAADNVTVGDAIPGLLGEAQTRFGIALDGARIVDLFSTANSSCATENASVGFEGSASRSVGLQDALFEEEEEEEEEMEEEDWVPTETLRPRDTSTTTSASNGAATSNGIIYQTGSPTSSSSPTSSTSSASASASSSASSSGNSTVDFASVAVSFVLQDSGQSNAAISAQEILQDYFRTGVDGDGTKISATNITLATGYSADLETRTVTVENGTVVGG